MFLGRKKETSVNVIGAKTITLMPTENPPTFSHADENNINPPYVWIICLNQTSVLNLLYINGGGIFMFSRATLKLIKSFILWALYIANVLDEVKESD